MRESCTMVYEVRPLAMLCVSFIELPDTGAGITPTHSLYALLQICPLSSVWLASTAFSLSTAASEHFSS